MVFGFGADRSTGMIHFIYNINGVCGSSNVNIYIFFALNLAANQEYYHQWNVEECHGCSLDLSTFTVEELDNITSEYTLKNTVR